MKIYTQYILLNDYDIFEFKIGIKRWKISLECYIEYIFKE